MPRAFDSREQDAIKNILRETGARLFRTQGVSKTTIDELGRAAGIAKGSFYKFYGSKELLYFEILDDVHVHLRAPLVADDTSAPTRGEFERRLQRLLTQICNEPLIMLMARPEEFQVVRRRVPAERLRAHESRDQAFIDEVIRKWSALEKPPPRDVVAARLSMALLVCFRQDFLGDRLFSLALAASIESLADCFFKS